MGDIDGADDVGDREAAADVGGRVPGGEVACEGRCVYPRGEVRVCYTGLGDEDVEVGGALREGLRDGSGDGGRALDVVGWGEEST